MFLALVACMKHAVEGVKMKYARWRLASSLSSIGIAISAGKVVKARPLKDKEALPILSQMRGRAEGLRWLCADGRLLDVAMGAGFAHLLVNVAEFQPLLDDFRNTFPSIGRIGAMTVPLFAPFDVDEISKALAAVSIYAEQKTSTPIHKRNAAASTFELYAQRSRLTEEQQVHTWYLACHIYIQARRVASLNKRIMHIKAPGSWRSLDDHRDFQKLAFRVRRITKQEPPSKKRRFM